MRMKERWKILMEHLGLMLEILECLPRLKGRGILIQRCILIISKCDKQLKPMSFRNGSSKTSGKLTISKMKMILIACKDKQWPKEEANWIWIILMKKVPMKATIK